MSFIFRAYHAMQRSRSMSTRGGLPTAAIYVFVNMIKKLRQDFSPLYFAAVFDVSGEVFRDGRARTMGPLRKWDSKTQGFVEVSYEGYKANRAAMPEDLRRQIPYIRRALDALRIPILEAEGFEADDVIGTLARLATRDGNSKDLEVFIVTSDKDLRQLVTKDVTILDPTKNDLLIDEKKVEELMGVPPSKVADVMALMGDSIDNIPGARNPNDKPAPGERRKAGIGDVGARQLIQQFGSVEEALKRAGEVKRAGYREALQNCAEFVLLSKQLATIPTDAPVPLDLDLMKMGPPDTEALRELYSELGFTSLLRDLAPLTDHRKTDYLRLEMPGDTGKFLGTVKPGQETAAWLALDAQEADEEGFGTRVLGVELSTKIASARISENDAQDQALAALGDWLADPKKPKVVHDPKLFNLLAAKDIASDADGVAGIRHATMLYSYLLRPTTAKHEFAEVVLRHLNRTLSGAPGERADFLLRLAPVLREEVEKLGLLEVYEKIDLPLAPVLARMEAAGVRVDPAELDRISTKTTEEIARIEKSIFELVGFEFNVGSPQQLAEVLFDKLNLQPPRRSRAKSRSTAADVLEELATEHALPKKVIEFRELTKLKSNYADVLPRLIHPGSGRLHTRFSQTGAVTGRLSSSNPNLQNIPIRTELGREIRAAFIAAPGSLLLSADYSQIELRILAHLSEDPVLVEAFRRGEDIHSRTAQEVFDIAPFAQTREHRRVAKVINFGVIYGLSAFGLAQQLDIDQKEAARFIAKYFERYRGVKEFLDGQIAETRKSGITKTLFGRIRPIPEINSPQPNLRNFAERTAMNTPMQGAAADLIKLAMIELDRRLPKEKFKSRMILQVHDELLFEGPETEIPKLTQLAKEVMEGVHQFRVPIVADTKVGHNWRDMK